MIRFLFLSHKYCERLKCWVCIPLAPTFTELLPASTCSSVHTGRAVHIHCEIQAGSEAKPIINPPRGKHSSRYCGTFPAAYGRPSLTWECFWTATSPGESLVFEGFCCLLIFYVFWGIPRSHTLFKQLLQNEGRPLALFFLLQGKGT